MTKPDFVLERSSQTPGGSLRTADLRTIRSKLMSQGLILFPSDTSYRLGSYAAYEDAVEILSSILSVDYSEIHLTAPNFEILSKWIDGGNYIATSLFEQLTPGPVTIVCKPSATATDGAPAIRKLAETNNDKAGFRVPDSLIERDISATNEHYLMSSAPIADHQVTDFEQALSIVQSKITKYGRAGWGAVEGEIFWSGRATVVGVDANGTIDLIEEGCVQIEQIESAARSMPSTSFEDWG